MNKPRSPRAPWGEKGIPTPETETEARVRACLDEYAERSGNAETAAFLRLERLNLATFPQLLFEHESVKRVCRSVQQLDLSYNHLNALPDNFPAIFPNLRILFCMKNDFTRLPLCLSRSESIQMLSFKSCKLSGELDASCLPPHLEWLILTDNKITSLSGDSPVRLGRVRKLLLACNRLTSFPNMELGGTMLDTIELLRLSNNELAVIPECLYSAPRLAFLGIGGNPCTNKCTTLSDLDSNARLDLQDFVLEDNASLGRGASGDVYLAKRKWETGNRMNLAVKVYRNFISSDGNVLDEMQCSLALRGLPGLIPVLGFFGSVSDEGSSSSPAAGLVMEAIQDMVPLGNAPSFATITRDVLADGKFRSLTSVSCILHQIAEAVAGMHARGYMHGDLYAHNILVSAVPSTAPDALLVDLGAATTYSDPRMTAFEVRAFGYLVEDLLCATTSSPYETSLRQDIQRIGSLATQADISERPSFADLVKMLPSPWKTPG